MNQKTNFIEQQMMQFILGKWISKPIYVAAKLGIPDILDKGNKSINDLAQLTNTLPDPLYRMMRALVGVGIFFEIENHVFENTPLSECLIKGHLKSAALMFESDWHTPLLRKTFKVAKGQPWTILDRDIVDEIIFKTDNFRNRLMMELMARGGMRVGEVLKLKAKVVYDRKLFLADPKSGRQTEIVFIPKKIADRLREYITYGNIEDGNRVFPLGYTRALEIVKNAGKLINVILKPHDLRRHAATYASRSGVPIEIVSKIILRHANLSTTQKYLGKVSDNEAIYWIENIYK